MLIPKRMVLVCVLLFAVLGLILSGTVKDHIFTSGQEVHLPQCGHWALVRAAEHVGIPIGAAEAYRLLPPNRKGHSVQEIADALKSAGADVTVRNESATKLFEEDFPVILHLERPDHFVVALGFESPDRLLITDAAGENRIVPLRSLVSRVTGFGIIARRNLSQQPKHSTRSEPSISFTSLSVNKVGILPSETEVQFEFPFRNEGNQPLKISNVHTKCHCISAQFPKEPVAPGENGVVTPVYRVDPQKPGFLEEAAVESNDPQHGLLMLRASGRLNVNVSVNPSILNFDLVEAGSTKNRLVFIRFREKAMAVTAVVIGEPHVTAAVLQDSEFDSRRIWEGAQDRPEHLKDWPVVCVELTLKSNTSATFEVEGHLSLSTPLEEFKDVRIPLYGRVVGC